MQPPPGCSSLPSPMLLLLQFLRAELCPLFSCESPQLLQRHHSQEARLSLGHSSCCYSPCPNPTKSDPGNQIHVISFPPSPLMGCLVSPMQQSVCISVLPPQEVIQAGLCASVTCLDGAVSSEVGDDILLIFEHPSGTLLTLPCRC